MLFYAVEVEQNSLIHLSGVPTDFYLRILRQKLKVK
jgi:hypothetical protein